LSRYGRPPRRESALVRRRPVAPTRCGCAAVRAAARPALARIPRRCCPCAAGPRQTGKAAVGWPGLGW